MMERIQQLLSETYSIFKSAGSDKNSFFELSLSVLAWKTLSELSINSNSSLRASWKAPSSTYSFDIVMSKLGEKNHKNIVEKSLAEWEVKNKAVWTGLLKIDQSLIQDVSDEDWRSFCLKWQEFFFEMRLEYPNHLDVFNATIQQLELLMSHEQLETSYLVPKELASLMVNYLSSNTSNDIYDPFCRSGNLLAAFAKTKDIKNVSGISSTRLDWKLANIRLIGSSRLKNINIKKGFVSDASKYDEEKRYDLIITNPPFGTYSSKDTNLYVNHEWSYYALKSGRIDLKYLCHVLSKLSDSGQASIIVPSSYLSNQGILREFIKHVIERNILDAAMALPLGTFAQTGVSTALLYFNFNRKKADRVFLIDASKSIKRQGKLIQLETDKIGAFNQQIKDRKYKNSQYVHAATIEEIKLENYNLQIQAYASPISYIDKLSPSKEIWKECIKIENKLIIAKSNIKKIMTRS